MEDLYEEAANNFLELSSQQRLQIIFRLLEKKSKITNMAKEIGATVQEVHRNFARLEDGGLLSKTPMDTILLLHMARQYARKHHLSSFSLGTGNISRIIPLEKFRQSSS